MKLLTYLEEGRFRTGILTVRPDSTEPVVLGIQDAVALLEAQAARVYWRTPWTGPWGVLTARPICSTSWRTGARRSSRWKTWSARSGTSAVPWMGAG